VTKSEPEVAAAESGADWYFTAESAKFDADRYCVATPEPEVAAESGAEVVTDLAVVVCWYILTSRSVNSDVVGEATSRHLDQAEVAPVVDRAAEPAVLARLVGVRDGQVRDESARRRALVHRRHHARVVLIGRALDAGCRQRVDGDLRGVIIDVVDPHDDVDVRRKRVSKEVTSKDVSSNDVTS